MQISFLIANLNICGAVRRVVSLSNRLVERGYAVTVYHSDGLPCAWLPCSAATKPLETITQDKHDLVIHFGGFAGLLSQIVARAKAYYILGINESDLDGIAAFLRSSGPVAGKRSLQFRDAIQDKNHLILANCSALVEWFKQFRPDVYPVIGGVDFGIFYPRSNKVAFRVAMSGAKKKIEGTALVTRAAETAKKKLPQIELIPYAGQGYSQAKLAELYSSADVYIDAQTRGGWNNPVGEAMACKAAVVCTDIFGNRDFACHLETAYVAKNDPEALATGLLQVLEDGDLRERLVRNAYKTIRLFTWDRATDQLEAVIRERL